MTSARSPSEVRRAIEGGLLCFPLTDFDPQSLAFNADGYRERLEWLGLYGAAALFPAGGAGEYFSLTEAEYQAVVRETVDWSRGRIPVIAAAGGSTRAAIDHAQAAERIGADGILLLPPYMTEASQLGLTEHIAAICDAVRIGVIVYNRGNCRLTPETVVRLAERCPNLIGIKDGLGVVETLLGMRALVGDRLIYINGMPTAEVYAPGHHAMGAPTYSSAIFNFIPRTARALHAAVAARDLAAYDALYKQFLQPYVALRSRQPGYAVSIVKAGVDHIGRSAGPVRPPLSNLTSEERTELGRLIAAMGPQEPAHDSPGSAIR
jgi:5-dehydro-4-deoxyglucarate dehydratase